MKVLLGILLLLFASILECYSQASDTNTIRLIKLPPDGLLLDKGWQFHGGDDSTWATPNFDDRSWTPVNPAQDIRQVHQLQIAHLGWFRIKLLVDSALFEQSLGILLSQTGASEIYLNGKLVYKFGQVSSIKNEETTYRLYNRPFDLKLNSQKFQTIAVRYSFLHNGFLIGAEDFQNYCLKILINYTGRTYGFYQKQLQFKLINELCLVCFLACVGNY
ncbi:MAG: hypothetical protein WDM78_21400 [Puia sp.]